MSKQWQKFHLTNNEQIFKLQKINDLKQITGNKKHGIQKITESLDGGSQAIPLKILAEIKEKLTTIIENRLSERNKRNSTKKPDNESGTKKNSSKESDHRTIIDVDNWKVFAMLEAKATVTKDGQEFHGELNIVDGIIVLKTKNIILNLNPSTDLVQIGH